MKNTCLLIACYNFYDILITRKNIRIWSSIEMYQKKNVWCDSINIIYVCDFEVKHIIYYIKYG